MKAYVIDGGGYLKVSKDDKSHQVTINSYGITTSPGYRAPEIFKGTNPKLDKANTKEYDSNLKINMKKAMSYTCGKLIEHI